ALGLSGGLLALLLRRPLVGRGAGPRAGLVRLALAGEVQGGRLGVSLEIGIFCTLSALFNQSWFVRG
ncbi:hypothetical protein ACUOJC_23150, partial [Escherichia coli]